MGEGEWARAVGQLWDRVLVLAERAEPGDWDRRTPCAAWDVHDLFTHLSGLQTRLNGAPQPAPPAGWAPPEGLTPLDASMEAGVAARREWPRERVVDELRAAREGHVAALGAVTDWEAPADGPAGRTTEAGRARLRCFDLWIHLWDLSTALDAPFDLDDPSPGAREAHRYVLDLVPWMFVKRAGAGDGATLRVRLDEPLPHDAVLAVRGRRAGWEEGADPGDCVVAGRPAALTLLTSGRGDPGHWRAVGALGWAGPRGEDFVARARLFAGPAG